jgi:hypothetical protein
MNDITLDEPQWRILLAGGESLQAPAYVLRCMSSCACGLPADAADWDLSGLLLEGLPVPAATVKAWLGAVCNCLKTEFDGGYQTELSSACRTAKGLYQLLQFADAVGSRQGVLHACLASLATLQFVIPDKYEPLELDAGKLSSVGALPVHVHKLR